MVTAVARRDPERISHRRCRRGAGPSFDAIVSEVARVLGLALRPPLVSVVNATGVILHTNLGRAPLAMRDRCDGLGGGRL